MRSVRAGSMVSGAFVLVPFLLVALVLRGVASPRAPSVGAAFHPEWGTPGTLAATYPSSLTNALKTFRDALDPGGSGFHFQVVQRNTEYAKPGGPLIGLTDPSDPRKIVGQADELYVNAMTSSGAVSPDAFWMDMRLGPAKDDPADFLNATLIFRVVERDGALWRNDGQGWYATDQSPGMGTDPVTMRLLPKMLGSLTSIEVLPPSTIEGIPVTGLRGTAARRDFPGVVAADGLSFTQDSFPVEFWFDASGHLLQLVARAKNLNATTYDLVSETTIAFTYEPAGRPPEPNPTMGPEPSRAPDEVVEP